MTKSKRNIDETSWIINLWKYSILWLRAAVQPAARYQMELKTGISFYFIFFFFENSNKFYSNVNPVKF